MDKLLEQKYLNISNQKLKDLGWDIKINLMEGLKEII